MDDDIDVVIRIDEEFVLFGEVDEIKLLLEGHDEIVVEGTEMVFLMGSNDINVTLELNRP